MITAHYGNSTATYTEHRKPTIDGPHLDLPNYRQVDVHVCGFVAALTVARYYNPDISDREVLKAVRPLKGWGINADKLITGLRELGFDPFYATRVTISSIQHNLESGVPVIVSLWPRDYLSDHWVVVRGMTKSRVYLTNHHSLSIDQFKREWSDFDMRGRGYSQEGIICWHD